MKGWLGIAAIVALIGLAVAYEVAVWNECLDTNSVLYCMRVLAK
jgi:hypothetical protein